MGHRILKPIGDEKRTATNFTLIRDSTPDIACVEQLILVMRCVLESGEPCERLSLGYKAQEMFSAVISEILTTLGQLVI